MLSQLKRLMARLDIPYDGTNRMTRLLNWITLAISLVAVLYACLFSVLIGRFDVVFYGVCAIVLSLGINLLARRGQTRIAAIIFVLGVWIIVTVPNFSPHADGIYDAAFTAYIVPILLAGFLIGGSASFVFAMMSVVAGFGFLVRSLTLPITFIEAQSSSQILHFTALSLFFMIAATLFALTNRSLSEALKRAQSGEEKLLSRNRELEREILERQHIEAALIMTDQTTKQFQDYLKELHEVSMQLASVETLDELHRQAIELGLKRLGFDRLGWFMLHDDGKTLQGTYGTDVLGNVREERELKIVITLDNWTSSFERFTSSGHIYFLLDTDLKELDQPVARGWNAFAAVTHGDTILGWIVADNLIRQEPLQDYRLELMRLYGAMLGQLFVQKQTQQLLAEKDRRLSLALGAAHMHTWDWNLFSGEIIRNDVNQVIPLSAKSSYDEFIDQVYPDDRKAVLDAARKMVEHTGIFEVEYRVTDHDGMLHWLYSLGQPYQNDNGDIAGVAGVIQDITGRKSIEETLKHADQQAMELILEKERVGALTEFINTVSHDFKTPLAIINNSLYLLQRINDPVKQKDKLDLIKSQTLLLDKQIQDILTISRLEYSPQTASHPVNINILLDKIIDLFYPSFENKNQTIHLDLQPNLPNVMADADELDRAFVNLVENAINYTPVGGVITVTTHFINNEIECAITDTGIGMSGPDTHQIFNNFYRAENARMINSKGTGLGLAIVKRIVTNHNGNITVESELGKGTSFRLRFPVMVNVP